MAHKQVNVKGCKGCPMAEKHLFNAIEPKAYCLMPMHLRPPGNKRGRLEVSEFGEIVDPDWCPLNDGMVAFKKIKSNEKEQPD